MGYHKRSITPKGVYGEFSKVEEELDEIRESIEQKNKILELVEWSDLIGSIEGYLENHHPGVGISDLKAMSDSTKSAFKDGTRRD